MNGSPPLGILVSGASIAGLTVAYWLAQHGFTVTVVERSPQLRLGGQALDVRGPALTVAERMGILDALRAQRTKLTGFSMVDRDGKELHRSEERTLTGGHLQSPDVEIMRDDLCRALRAAVGESALLQFDDSVASLEQDSRGVDVTFERGAPRRFDLVVGADGLHSRIRKLTFGPEAQFLRSLGNSYVAVFGMPNFLGLERWEVMYQDEQTGVGAMVMALHRTSEARAYVGFTADAPVDYDARDVAAQKQLLAERLAGAGWVVPEILRHMMVAPDFHFDSISQIRMERWSRGRVVLVGDAGYSVALASGQGTSVAMVGAYVLAGELAKRRDDPLVGIASYETALRKYVERNQDIAFEQHTQNTAVHPPGAEDAADVPDFGALTVPFDLADYALTSGA